MDAAQAESWREAGYYLGKAVINGTFSAIFFVFFLMVASKEPPDNDRLNHPAQ